jgi:hypothetical protein
MIMTCPSGAARCHIERAHRRESKGDAEGLTGRRVAFSGRRARSSASFSSRAPESSASTHVRAWTERHLLTRTPVAAKLLIVPRRRSVMSATLHRLSCHAFLLVSVGWCAWSVAPAHVFAQTSAAPAASAPSATAVEEGFLPEPHVLSRAIRLIDKRVDMRGGAEPKDGFYPELGNMVTGAGWISIGPGYRDHLFNGAAAFDVSTAMSWRGYKMAQGRFELPRLAGNHLTVGSQVLWQDLTQVTWFGVGSDSLQDTRSEYRVKNLDVVGYAIVRPFASFSIGTRAGWLRRPTLGEPAGHFKRGNPSAQDIFPDDPALALDEQPNYLHTEIFGVADTRDHSGYPSEGYLYRGSWARYSDRDAGRFSFQRVELEGAHFLPVVRGRWILALHGWSVLSDTAEGQTIPLYLMPSLGGGSTLRSFVDYRFHDRHLLSGNVESRWRLMTHVDVAAFLDAGNVAVRVRDLDFAKRSVGVGIRLHTDSSTLLRFDVAHGDEGWRFLVRTHDPLRFARLKRRTAAVPFVP